MNFTLPDTFNHDPPDVLDTSQPCTREQTSIFARWERLGPCRAQHRLKQARQLRVHATPKITKIAQNSDFPTKTPKSRFPPRFLPAGRLQTLIDSRVSTTPFTYAYQAQTNGVAGHRNADGSASVNEYDVLGRLTRVSAATGAGAGLNSYGYQYDAAGQRTEETSTVGTRQFGYDDQRQLTSAYRIDGSGQPLPDYNYSFAYDPIGNWKSETTPAGTTQFTANALNQYTSITNPALANPAAPQYDLNGNMTSDGKGNTYQYDQENRLIEADTPGQVVAKVVSVYDGLSRRVEKRTYDGGGNLTNTIRYLYDGLLPIAEFDAQNNLTRTFTRGLDLSGTMQGAGGIGGLLALTDGTGSYSYFCDGNGNVVDVTNAYGTNVSHTEYDPFGNVVAQSGTLQQPYQWSSKESDGNGLVYYLYRFYNPAIGRWENRDPLEEIGGLNNYLYLNNSINNLDDFGLSSSPEYIDNFDPFWGGGKSDEPLDQSAWFEKHYKNWVQLAKDVYTKIINGKLASYCTSKEHPSQVHVPETIIITPYFRGWSNKIQGPADNSNETLLGDSPQTPFEVDYLIGSFTFGVKQPDGQNPHIHDAGGGQSESDGVADVSWSDDGCCEGDKNNHKYRYKWSATLVIYDRAGIHQKPIIGFPFAGWGTLLEDTVGTQAHERIVIRAQYPLKGEGSCCSKDKYIYD